MITHVMGRLGELLKTISLVAFVRAAKYDTPFNAQNFIGMLENYSRDTWIFFTPVREIRISLQEMQEVSGLPNGDFLYEEYIPNSKELNNPHVYKTY